jgi:hypothetical protein
MATRAVKKPASTTTGGKISSAIRPVSGGTSKGGSREGKSKRSMAKKTASDDGSTLGADVILK